MDDPVPNALVRASRALWRLELDENLLGKPAALLAHPKLTSFWSKGIAIVPDAKHDAFARELLEIMVLKGGAMKRESLKSKRKRRLGLANQITKLQAAIKKDDRLRLYALTDLLDLIGDANVQQVLDTFREPLYDERYRDPFRGATVRHALNQQAPPLTRILEAIEKALVEFLPLNNLDDVTYNRQYRFMPAARRQNRRERFVERLLCDLFERFSGSAKPQLVVQALEALFGIEVDELDVRKRWDDLKHRKQ